MEEQIKALDENLVNNDRINYESEIRIYCKRIYEDRIHQTTVKVVNDIPFNVKKVFIHP